MDPRVRRHAEILVDHCTRVRADDDVLVKASPAAEDLVVALYALLGERGAQVTTDWVGGRKERAYARAVDVDDLRTPDHELAAMRETDVAFLVGSRTNLAEASDVDPEKTATMTRTYRSVVEERLDARWVITAHPTPAAAQKAGMSTEAYADFVYDAVNRDWAAQRGHQEQLVEILDPADEVRVVSGDDTDLRLSVDGMTAANDYGRRNMPGGEVFTSPVPDSVEGEVVFDLPVVRNGREIRDARLVFEDGEVVEYSAARNEDVLASILDTDRGARRVGELGIGMNRGIDRFTYNMLFDEKMGDTIHLALGDAVDECVPDDREFNDSAVHADMLVDVGEDSRIEVDGEVVQRDGTFVFEDGFEG